MHESEFSKEESAKRAAADEAQKAAIAHAVAETKVGTWLNLQHSHLSHVNTIDRPRMKPLPGLSLPSPVCQAS